MQIFLIAGNTALCVSYPYPTDKTLAHKHTNKNQVNEAHLKGNYFDQTSNGASNQIEVLSIFYFEIPAVQDMYL